MCRRCWCEYGRRRSSRQCSDDDDEDGGVSCAQRDSSHFVEQTAVVIGGEL